MVHPRVHKGRMSNFYSPKEVAKVLGLEPEAIFQLVDAGKLTCKRVEHVIGFTRGDIASYVWSERRHKNRVTHE